MARPRTVWSPRNGEKPKNTPRLGQRGPVRRVVRVEQLLEPALEPGGKHRGSEVGEAGGKESRPPVSHQDHVRCPRQLADASQREAPQQSADTPRAAACPCGGTRTAARSRRLPPTEASRASIPRPANQAAAARIEWQPRRIDHDAGAARLGDLADGVRQPVAQVHARAGRPGPAQEGADRVRGSGRRYRRTQSARPASSGSAAAVAARGAQPAEPGRRRADRAADVERDPRGVRRSASGTCAGARCRSPSRRRPADRATA